MSAAHDAAPPNAKQVGGVWLPETEDHFEAWMKTSKRARTVDGKLTYQYHKLEAALRRCPPARRRVALDVGAHVGLWAMWLVDHFEHIHAFEPVPLFANILPRNMRGRDNYTLHRCALGNEAMTVSVTVPMAQTGGAHVSNRKPVNVKYNPGGETDTYHAIPMRKLDSFGFSQVDFVKIDVEGYEPEVLRGGERTIRRCRPVLIVECKGNERAFGHEANAALRLLEGWGATVRERLSGDYIMSW
jgi:FkbM family methyltransferase